MAWRRETVEAFKGDCEGAPVVVVRSSCACLAGVVKSNSSGKGGLERFIDSMLAYTPSGLLVEKQLKALNPPQHRLGVTGKSSTPREKFISYLRLFLLLIYF